MLSSLSLCSPREWSLACLALSGPFATTGIHIFRKAPARQAAGGSFSGKRLVVRQLEVIGGSPSGEELEGESPRGGERVAA